MKSFLSIVFFFMFITAAGILISGSDTEEKRIPGEESITSAELDELVRYFASPELEGRLAGSQGYNTAALYAVNMMESLGLEPKGGRSYFQDFTIEYNEVIPPAEFSTIDASGKKTHYTLGDDYVFRGFTGSGRMTAPVVFCGYGISEPATGYDDFDGVDVKGKIALVFKYNPRWKYADSISFQGGTPRYKSNTAAEHGAIGILYVSFPNDEHPQPLIGSVAHGEGKQLEDFPQLHISIEAANELLKGSGYRLNDLQERIDNKQQPFSIELSSSAHITANSKYDPERETYNIVGYLEGSDPVLKDEYVIIGAHLDHVGSQAGEIYFPGANDNASGSAALLEIAEAFTGSKTPPKRSILFILFSAEESGLEGADYYVEHPVLPLDKAVAIFNMDCIGSGDSLRIGNGKSAPKLWSFIKEIDRNHARLMIDATWGGGGADGTPFHKKGIPLAYCVTKNTYEHLHQLSDTPETLNLNLFTEMTKLVYRSAFAAAQGEYEREEIVNQ
jgi:hypothetical protein